MDTKMRRFRRKRFLYPKSAS